MVALSMISLILCTLLVLTSCSPNGAYYTCTLDNGLCIFTATADAPFTTATPHDADISVASDFNRMVANSAGNALSASPLPLTQGDTLASSTIGTITGDAWNFVLATQIAFKLRDAIMFYPSTITGTTEWAAITKAFVDCSVKAVDVDTAYSVDSIYEILKDPVGNSINTGQPMTSGNVNNYLLQFLEEGCVDLICVATDTTGSLATFERCITIRETLGLGDGESSTCWHAGYEAIFGVAPPLDAAETPAPTTVTTTTTPTATPAPTTTTTTGAPTATPTTTTTLPTITPAPTPSDLTDCETKDSNSDNVIDISDLANLLVQWGDCADITNDLTCADSTGDLLVDINDLANLLVSWGDCVIA